MNLPKHFAPGKRYYDFNTYLNQRFGCKVYKVTIDAGFTCPNRDGKVAKGGCIYCNADGSGNGMRSLSVRDQVLRGIEFVQKRYKADKIMVYFQAYTNTYADVGTLERIYNQAFCHPDIVALAIGTRPDCIDDDKLKMINQYTSEYEVWMEYGLESSHNRTLTLINRMETYEQFVQAVELTQKYPMKMCTHLMMGLPGETREDMMETVRRIASLSLDAVKIHSLYIERNTSLERFYNDYQFPLLSEEEYVQIVCDSLQLLPEKMIVARLTGDPIPSELYVPEWTRHKHRVLQRIEQVLQERNTYQGAIV